jgi:hypothetical protein
MNKKILYLSIAAVIIVVALICAYLWHAAPPEAAPAASIFPSPAVSTSPSTTATTIPSISPKTARPQTTPKPSTLKAAETYQGALKTYGGFRFQFTSCHAIPGSMVLKQGQKFMLDNRDEKAHTIAVGSQKYPVAPYNFAIATAPKTLGEVRITCDNGGSASISVSQ